MACLSMARVSGPEMAWSSIFLGEHRAVVTGRRFPEASGLPLARGLHALPELLAGLAPAGMGQLLDRRHGHVDLETDAVQQRPGDAPSVLLHGMLAAAAGMPRVA